MSFFKLSNIINPENLENVPDRNIFTLLFRFLNYHFFHYYLIFTLSFFIYSNSQKNEFIYDDYSCIILNNFIKDFNNLPKLIKKEYFQLSNEGTYRPICTLTYFIDYQFWKLNPAGWHLSNTIFHSINGILIYYLLLLIFKNKIISLSTGLFFVSHPIHTEVLNCTSFREDLLCMMFMLGGFISFVKYRINNKKIYKIFSILFFIVALFTKEVAVILPFLLIAYDYLLNEKNISKKINLFVKEIIKEYFIFILILGLWTLLRYTLFKPIGIISGMDLSNVNTGFVNNSFYSTIFTSFKLIVFYILKLIYPVKQIMIPTGESLIKPSVSILELNTFFAFLILLSLIFIMIKWYRKEKVISFSLFFYFIAIFPVSNIIPFWVKMAERYLYIPSLGFFILLSYGISRIKNKLLLFVIVLFIIIFYSKKTIARNEDWKNEITLWNQTVTDFPNSTLAHNNLGNAYVMKKDYEKSIKEYEKVIKIDPYHFYTYNNLAFSYRKLNRKKEAYINYEKAIKINPNYSEAHNNFGLLLKDLKDYEKSETMFKKAILINPYFDNAYNNLVNLYCVELNDFRKAENVLKKAIEMMPENIVFKENLKFLYKKQADKL